jgi:hypothetical protein
VSLLPGAAVRVSLISNANCRCNAALSGHGWNDWVDHWLTYAGSSTGWSGKWFRRNQQDVPYYFGWNEVPVWRTIDQQVQSWDALLIKLPAQADSLRDLPPEEQRALDFAPVGGSLRLTYVPEADPSTGGRGACFLSRSP